MITKQNVADSDVIYVSVLFPGTNQNLCIISLSFKEKYYL